MSSQYHLSVLECGCGAKWSFYYYTEKNLTEHYDQWNAIHKACSDAWCAAGSSKDGAASAIKGFGEDES